MATPTDAFISKLKSNIATLSSDKLDLEQDKAKLQHQVANLQDEIAATQRKLEVAAQANSSGVGKPIDFDNIVKLEDELAQDRAEFKDFIIAANDKVAKAEATASHWKEKVEDEQRFSASLKRQLEDAKDTMKALRAQKTNAEKNATDAKALVMQQTKELAKAQKQKRAAEVKYSRQVISSDVDAGKTTTFNFSTPKAFGKPVPKSTSTFGRKPAAATKPAFSKASSKHPGDPPSKNQPPSKIMSQLSIGKTKDMPFVLDEDEDDIPLAQRRFMNASKRKNVHMQDGEDEDDEELIPIRIKRERIE
ncbi:uncharacterized protein MYCFIDRAFT_83647 [Pseudocercospora fijiensis CIRAD86]|uniref:Uncharacterized protein n=1 Tax=Pseudocercospora fijiensis (strain CIRAD86) TaxID=383855 RepID=M3BB53_PSEFD|nr:uncharacterized protein MYCFIDRAFT_83647 [Pseudocercospora fijiensis CIRAD86]EME86537.1 hypothetical protein MYCFIDRAFT_83647 [Pseudocercospora fijiensis CIRAD86]